MKKETIQEAQSRLIVELTKQNELLRKEKLRLESIIEEMQAENIVNNKPKKYSYIELKVIER